MKIDGSINSDPTRAAESATQAEANGFHGLWTVETSHDPFVALTLAAEHTSRIELGTAIAVAFARSPMTVATTAHDLQLLSEGRFALGLGSQVKSHIEKRFSMPWSHPAARMREFVAALHAIWSAWNDGTKLEFRGDFYTHTLMTPFFSPPPSPHGRPKVYLASVGERMTEVAGEMCDGLLVHGLSTERYFREVTRPALERGRAAGGGSMEGFEVSWPHFVVVGTNEDELCSAATATKQQIAFYGSTPAYRGMLEIHGWGELQTELTALSKQGKWVEMGGLIDDEMLHTFAAVGSPDEVGRQLRRRLEGLATRVGIYSPYHLTDDTSRSIVSAMEA